MPGRTVLVTWTVAPLSLPKSMAAFRHAIVEGDNDFIPGQLAAPGIITEHIAPTAADLVRRDLHLVVPSLKKGDTLTLQARFMESDNSPDPTGFVWQDFFKGKPQELIYSVLGGMKNPEMRAP